MNPWTVFSKLGEHVYLVTATRGELDRSTGLRPTTYKYERSLALVGSKKYGFEFHLKLEENMIVLPKKADIVVIGSDAFKTELVGSHGGMYIHQLNKVVSHELKSIVDSIPKSSGG